MDLPTHTPPVTTALHRHGDPARPRATNATNRPPMKRPPWICPAITAVAQVPLPGITMPRLFDGDAYGPTTAHTAGHREPRAPPHIQSIANHPNVVLPLDGVSSMTTYTHSLSAWSCVVVGGLDSNMVLGGMPTWSWVAVGGPDSSNSRGWSAGMVMGGCGSTGVVLGGPDSGIRKQEQEQNGIHSTPLPSNPFHVKLRVFALYMEHKAQTPGCSSYVSAPTSPGGCSEDDMQYFYSAPSSPIKRLGRNVSFSYCYESGTQKMKEDINSDLDDFEFETSKKFGDHWEFEGSPKFECLVGDEEKQEQLKQPEGGNSFSRMAFADDIFSNGQVLPLKLPPRLQYTSQSSIPTSPRSPSSVLKIPFSLQNTWNNDYDPFAIALKKVSKEKKGRPSVHRRARSHSPFRSPAAQSPNDSGHKPRSEVPQPQRIERSPSELGGSRGSVYARYLRSQTMGHKGSLLVEPNARGLSKPRVLSFGRKVRPEKLAQEGPIKPTVVGPETVGPNKQSSVKSDKSCGEESRMRKMKGLLIRYASFGMEKRDSEGKAEKGNQLALVSKPSYFKKLSFKFKQSGHINGKKKDSPEAKMAVVQYRPLKMALCLGYGMESPRNSK
ncbi:hypothetical protein RJ640_018182 [Escallonia rubra]|uniref:Uncharacterized protein n=1 Tax=Escallonia rubra TaxID=112253 RepID=A0AA88R933_9ASTE|nr:hypothetical protein RJ640_018182 [Escallonia rubra]